MAVTFDDIRAAAAGPVLRSTPDRASWCEGARFVKAFRARDPWRRPFDRRRAQRELSGLAALAERGVASAAPVGIERRGGAWLSVVERLPGRDLRAHLASPGAGAPADRVLRAVSTLVATAHARGAYHGDLHPGNVQVDPEGTRAWLVDPARLVLTGGWDPIRARDDLARLGGECLGSTSPGLRARFLAAYRRRLPRAAARSLEPLAAAARDLERGARASFERAVRENADRWLRASSRLCEVEGDLMARALSEAERTSVRGWLDGEPLDAGFQLVEGPAGRVRRRWRAAARAFELGVSATEPLGLRLRRGRGRALLRDHSA